MCLAAVDTEQPTRVYTIINLQLAGLRPAALHSAATRAAVYLICQTFSVRTIKNGWFELIQVEKIIITSVNHPCSNKYTARINAVNMVLNIMMNYRASLELIPIV